jgi:hypothetical protein
VGGTTATEVQYRQLVAHKNPTGCATTLSLEQQDRSNPEMSLVVPLSISTACSYASQRREYPQTNNAL